jgi:hypothetical protein
MILEMDGYDTTLFIIATISCFSSLSVILSLLLFQNLQNHSFMRVIAFISFADLLGNVSYLFWVRPANDSALCVVEAFLNVALYPASWLWTTTLTYFLYFLATEKQVIHDLFPFYHARNWSIPVILFLIEVPFTLYQHPDGLSYEVCTIAGLAAGIYHDITFYGLFLICVGRMLYLLAKIRSLEKEQFSGVQDRSFQIAKSALILYPISLIICWFPHFFTVVVYLISDFTGYSTVYYYGILLKISHGTVAAFIFFAKSHQARINWFRAFGGNLVFKEDQQPRFTSSDTADTENVLHHGNEPPARLSEIEIKDRFSHNF